MSVIAIDSGSSYLKMFHGDKPLMFPAVSHRLMGATDYPDEVALQGTRYAVGQTALLASTKHRPDPHLDRGFHGSHEQTIQICYALAQAGAEGTYDVLCMSLPYADSRIGTLRNRIKTMRRFQWEDITGGHEVAFNDVMVLPQGVGALRLWQADSQRMPEVVTLVDIGSCTLDIVTVQRDPRHDTYAYNGDASSSYRDVSVGTFKNTWQSRLRQLDGLQSRTFGYHQLMGMAMQSPLASLQQGHEKLDISQEYRQAAVELTEQVYDRARSTTGDLWLGVEQVLLTGGGAQLIDKLAWPDWQRTRVLDIFANVRGQYLAAGGAIAPQTEDKQS
jgi:hypothetical protein